MRKIALLMTIFLLIGANTMTAEDKDKITKVIEQAGIKSTEKQRGQKDIIGFASTAEQFQSIVDQSREFAKQRQQELIKEGINHKTAFTAAICPHDDYGYAGRLYQLVSPHLKAKHVIIFGVFHFARYFDCEELIVFDSFESWRTPQGSVPVSSLRETLISKLPEDNFIVENRMSIVEHSLEALVPWVREYNPDVEILPILVPYMSWERMQEVTDNISKILNAECKKNNWVLGEDLTVLISSDAVHYGDVGWGGKKIDDFGVDIDGYKKAVNRDISLTNDFLCNKIEDKNIKKFMFSCVKEDDIKDYKISWCGRFSIPFGLLTANKLNLSLTGKPLNGSFLDYGTSVSEATLNLDGLEPMGLTAPSNLHHWVGYTAIGYR